METDGAGQSVLRMALAMWAADVGATLEPHQRTWITDRLQRHTGDGVEVALTDLEIRTLLPALLAWGDARRTIVGPTLRDCYAWALGPAPVDESQTPPPGDTPSALVNWLMRAQSQEEREPYRQQKGPAHVHRRHARS